MTTEQKHTNTEELVNALKQNFSVCYEKQIVDSALDTLAAKVKELEAALEFNSAPDDADWGEGHPIFEMAQDNDRLNVRVKELEAQLSAYPADWRRDSSLESWFPYTAEKQRNLESKLSTVTAQRDRFFEENKVLREELDKALRTPLDALEQVTQERAKIEAERSAVTAEKTS